MAAGLIARAVQVAAAYPRYGGGHFALQAMEGGGDPHNPRYPSPHGRGSPAFSRC